MIGYIRFFYLNFYSDFFGNLILDNNLIILYKENK